MFKKISRVLRRTIDAINSNAQSAASINHWLSKQYFDALQNSPRAHEPKRLLRYTDRVFSQGIEDGVLAEIFRRIGSASQSAIEVGAGEGVENNTMFLLFQGWRCLWVEAAKEHAARIQNTHASWLNSGALTLRAQYISAANCEDLLAPFAREFGANLDLLSIDIDSQDYWVLKQALTFVNPRVITMEYNGTFPASVSITVPLDHPNHTGRFYGASLAALDTLLNDRYALVGCTPNGVNAFWVRRDLDLSKFSEPFTVENHYQANPFPEPHGNCVAWLKV